MPSPRGSSVKRPGVIDIIYRLDPAHPVRRLAPRTPAQAKARMERGNRGFAEILDRRGRGRSQVIEIDAGELGLGPEAGVAPAQRPFAAVLGCSDARVPIEMIFQQRANDLFVVRVAGNGIGSDCLGSLRYAATHFAPSLKVMAVLGHSQCGAVTAAVDAFLRPRTYLPLVTNHPLRAIVDAILVSVRSSSLALEAAHGRTVADRPGYRSALIEMSVVFNAAVAAYALRHEFDRPACRVVYGSFDLASRYVRLPVAARQAQARSEIGLFAAPTGEDELRRLAGRLASSARIRALLDPATSGLG